MPGAGARGVQDNGLLERIGGFRLVVAGEEELGLGEHGGPAQPVDGVDGFVEPLEKGLVVGGAGAGEVGAGPRGDRAAEPDLERGEPHGLDDVGGGGELARGESGDDGLGEPGGVFEAALVFEHGATDADGARGEGGLRVEGIEDFGGGREVAAEGSGFGAVKGIGIGIVGGRRRGSS